MISFTLDYLGKKFDLQLDGKQEIQNVLKVLYESGNISYDQEWHWCKSVLQQRVISVYKTFDEEKIYTGDILKFE
jgi:uncharacterized ubiquitin-like protein YukD